MYLRTVHVFMQLVRLGLALVKYQYCPLIYSHHGRNERVHCTNPSVKRRRFSCLYNRMGDSGEECMYACG